MPDAARRFALAVGIALVAAACNPGNQLRAGMQESEVIDLLGEATEVITEPSLMPEFFPQKDVKNCIPNAIRVLVYDRWINDVSVAVDAKGTVLCFDVVSYL